MHHLGLIFETTEIKLSLCCAYRALLMLIRLENETIVRVGNAEDSEDFGVFVCRQSVSDFVVNLLEIFLFVLWKPVIKECKI